MYRPTKTPTAYSSIVAPPRRKSVRGAASAMMSLTGRASRKDGPKSRVNMLRRYLKRATNGGSLIPNCSLSCWRRAWEKVGSERNRSIGLPGIARKSRNTITVTTKIVMTDQQTNDRTEHEARNKQADPEDL